MKFDWNVISAAVTTAIALAKPIVATAFPGAGFAITLLEKILDGAKKGAPDAIAMVNLAKSGGQITAAQLKEYADRYEMAYHDLDDSITNKLAELDARDGKVDDE